MNWKKYDVLSRILSIIFMGICLFCSIKLKDLLPKSMYEYKDDIRRLCIVLYAIGIVFNVFIIYCIVKGKQNDVFRIVTSCFMLLGAILATVFILHDSLVLGRYGFLTLIIVNIILMFIAELSAIVSLANVLGQSLK